MISIRQSVNELDQKDQLLEESLRCYGEAIAGIGCHAFECCPPIASTFRKRLGLIEANVNWAKIERNSEGIKRLTIISAELLATLADFSQKSVEIFRQDTANLRDILTILGSSAEALNSSNLVNADHFREFGQQLEDLTGIDDLTTLRRSLLGKVVDFRAKIDALTEESRSTINRLQEDVSVFRRKLDEAEMQAATDPLTGVSNRRELQRQIDMRIEVGKQFTLLMFDLDEFKGINDRFGHLAGDQVLKHFARTVRASVRPNDVVARWGGDEFIVLFDSSLEEAIGRSRQIFFKLEPPLAVQLAGRKVMLAIRASSGVAEHHKNETAQDLFTRVDANKPAGRLLSTV
jgi:diguanylate cyclase (GGDEF)-like protein